MLLFMMHFKYAALGNYTQTALLTVQGSFLQINVLGFSQEMTRKTLSTLLGVHLYLKYGTFVHLFGALLVLCCTSS